MLIATVAVSGAAMGEEIHVGGLYCLTGSGGPSHVLVAKVLGIESGVVHTRQYSNEFVSCPDSVDTSSLSWNVPDLPVREKGFLMLNPKLISQGQVSREEAEAVRAMKEMLRSGSKE